MEYFITFLEGLISFLSPCMLPMLPVYVSYFAGTAGQGLIKQQEPQEKQNVWPRALAFVLGFSVTFCLLGVLSGTVGAFLSRYRKAVRLFAGAVIVLFGLSYLELFPLPFFRGMKSKREITTVFSAFLFGLVYSVSLTPCVGTFLGSALMLAADSGSMLEGLLLLVLYSLGMGIPFFLSAVLIRELGSVFSFIKRHYRVINTVCGLFLIFVGILMMLGVLSRFSGLL